MDYSTLDIKSFGVDKCFVTFSSNYVIIKTGTSNVHYSIGFSYKDQELQIHITDETQKEYDVNYPRSFIYRIKKYALIKIVVEFKSLMENKFLSIVRQVDFQKLSELDLYFLHIDPKDSEFLNIFSPEYVKRRRRVKFSTDAMNENKCAGVISDRLVSCEKIKNILGKEYLVLNRDGLQVGLLFAVTNDDSVRWYFFSMKDFDTINNQIENFLFKRLFERATEIKGEALQFFTKKYNNIA